jgi:uncharacterized membrane-anchored protein YitT (DUF2179 family)
MKQITGATYPRHSFAEDIHAIIMGTSFAALGVVLLKAAGLALIIFYLTGWPVGPLFFCLNLPFFILAQRTMGWTFTIKSLLTTGLLSLLIVWMPQWLHISAINPIFASIFGGSITGMGVLALARHRSSVGGIGALALYLQEKQGISAGKVQVSADCLIVAAAFFAIDMTHLLLSIISAASLSLVMIAYHRPGRYTGY